MRGVNKDGGKRIGKIVRGSRDGKGHFGAGEVDLAGELGRSAKGIGGAGDGAKRHEGEIEHGNLEAGRRKDEDGVPVGEAVTRAKGGGEHSSLREKIWV